MANTKVHNWKDYFYSRINGNYSKTHKDILKLVDERLKETMDDYPNILFQWSEISDLYEECRHEYFESINSESKKTFNDGKLVIDGMTDAIFSYSPLFEARRITFDHHRLPFILPCLPSVELELVHWNKDKDCVYVELADGRSTVVKRYGDTKDDIYAAVAYAIAKIEFETNSNFKKEVDAHLKIKETKKNG